MQAWNSVQVKNPDSQHAGRAGVVIRTEKKGDATLVEVRLDESDKTPVELVMFDATELTLLGM
jgi:ribosomal protein L21E